MLIPLTSGWRQGDEPRLVVENERHVAPAAARGAAWATDVERLAGGAMPPYPGQRSAGRSFHPPRPIGVAPPTAPAGVILVLAAAAADGEVDAVERDAQHRPARARPHRRGRDTAQRRVRVERCVDDGATEATEQPAAVRWRPRVSWREGAEARARDVHDGAAIGRAGGRVNGGDGGGVEGKGEE